MAHCDVHARKLCIFLIAVKRIMQRKHNRWNIELTVFPVELEDNVGDLCRTFSAACATDDEMTLPCTVHNYLNKMRVRGARLEPDAQNRRTVVTVSSEKGTRECAMQ